MPEKTGVKNVKELVVDFGAELGNALAKTLDDGKFTLAESLNFVPALMKAPAAIEGIEDIDDELADMDDDEYDSLIRDFKERLQLPADYPVDEDEVVAVMEWSMQTVRLVQTIRNMKLPRNS